MDRPTHQWGKQIATYYLASLSRQRKRVSLRQYDNVTPDTNNTTLRYCPRMKKTLFILVALLSIGQLLCVTPAHASVANWQRGISVIPRSPTDFGSSSFQESLRNAKNSGINAVSLVIPYYQSNSSSIDIQSGWNTPTDDALASAIDYAHSIGLTVTLKPHLDPYSGEWRAHINPGDRNGWFANYGSMLQRVAQVGQSHHAEMIVIGTELVSMASNQIHSDNSNYWFTIIGNVRKVYSGKLTYGANSTNNNNDPFSNEKTSVGFWSALDYAGLSVYYNLNTSDNSVAALKGQWDYWNNNDLKQFAQRVNKPLLFLEIGYRSVDNAHTQPWNWALSGNYNPIEQSNSYAALVQYWDAYPYVQGVYWWNWDSNPSAGGSGNTDYTPQNKPAQQVLSSIWTNPGTVAGPLQPSQPTQPSPAPTPAPTGNRTLGIWWPVGGVSVSGIQPFKGMLESLDISQYRMYWRVGDGQLNPMYDNYEVYPHKQAYVDFTGWRWESSHRYTITFIAQDLSGNTIATASSQIIVP